MMKGFLPARFLLLIILFLPAAGTALADEPSICFLAAVTADSVNIRAEPTDQSPVVGRVWHGVGFKVTALQSGWFRVEAVNGKTGWIRCDYVETVSPCGGPPIPAAVAAPVALAGASEAAPDEKKRIYRIQTGDELGIKSYRFPELEVLVSVRPDGYISLVLLDDIYVQGMSLDELDAVLTEKYKEHFRNPDVTVLANVIQSVADRMVFIGGEVNRPMERALHTPITVLQSIVAAGGFTVGAKTKNVMLIRKNNQGNPQFFSLDLSNVKDGEPVPNDVYLQPYDVVYVPASAINKAGDFVDQYVNRIVPQALTFGVNWIAPTF